MPSESFVLFDVLGFREAMLQQPLEDVKNRMFRFFYSLRSATISQDVVDVAEDFPTYDDVMQGPKTVHFHQYSDSILLRAKEEAEANVETLVHAARHILAIGAIQGTPLRGVLAHGELDVVPEMNLYLGKGLVEAHDAERQQEWSGCVVQPGFTERWPDLVARLREAEALVDYPAPMKSGTYKRSLCVNWASKVVGDLEDILVGPAGIPRPGLPWDAYRKLKNTIDFFKIHGGA